MTPHSTTAEPCLSCGRDPTRIYLFGIEFRPSQQPTTIIGGVVWPCCCNCGHVLYRASVIRYPSEYGVPRAAFDGLDGFQLSLDLNLTLDRRPSGHALDREPDPS